GKQRTVLGANQDVRAHAPLPVLGILNHAVAQPHQAENEVHGDADQQDTQQATHGAVLDVFENKLAGHFFLVRPLAGGGGGVGLGTGASPTTWRVVPSGCARANLSCVTPLLISILTTSMTTAYSSRGRLISMCLGNGT